MAQLEEAWNLGTGRGWGAVEALAKRSAFFPSLSQAGIQNGCSGGVGKHLRRMHTFTTKCAKILNNSFVVQWFLPGSFFSFTLSEIQGLESLSNPLFATVASDKKWLWHKFACSFMCQENQTWLSSHPLSIFVNKSVIWRFCKEEVVFNIFKIMEEQPPI